jgi:hypothetical protein
MKLHTSGSSISIFHVHAHGKERSVMVLDSVLEAISAMSGPELERVREAIDSRRERLAQSTVVERRSYGSGILQLELRANPKTGTTRGPY